MTDNSIFGGTYLTEGAFQSRIPQIKWMDPSNKHVLIYVSPEKDIMKDNDEIDTVIKDHILRKHHKANVYCTAKGEWADQIFRAFGWDKQRTGSVVVECNLTTFKYACRNVKIITGRKDNKLNVVLVTKENVEI